MLHLQICFFSMASLHPLPWLQKKNIIASPGDQSCAEERCAGAVVAPGSDRGAWRQRLEKLGGIHTLFGSHNGIQWGYHMGWY